jgi:hypothetical protein
VLFQAGPLGQGKYHVVKRSPAAEGPIQTFLVLHADDMKRLLLGAQGLDKIPDRISLSLSFFLDNLISSR